MIDTLVAVETPEGVELEFSPAGPVPRAMAYGVDMLIRYVVYIALAMVLLNLGGIGQGLWLISLFLLEWFYPVVFEVLGGGRSPGKRLLGLRVLRADGAPVGWSRSMVRSFLMFADFLPFAFGTGLLAMHLGRRFQRLGDLAAGTVVVHDPAESRPLPAAIQPGLEPQAPPFALTLNEQRAVIGFNERLPGLTVARAEELAAILEPFTAVQPRPGVARLRAMADYLRGLQ